MLININFIRLILCASLYSIKCLLFDFWLSSVYIFSKTSKDSKIVK